MTVRIIRGQGVDACPVGYWALYDNVAYNKGGPADILIGDASAPNLKDVGFNDRASSYVNRTNYSIAMYEEAGYGGRKVATGPGQYRELVVHERTTRPYPFSDEEVGDMNDAVSSVRVYEPDPEPARLGTGLYTLVNVASGKALDVADASPANGANVQQWEANQSVAQQWRLDPLGDGVYTLTNKASGKLLDVAGEGDQRADGANVHQWQALGSDSQKWRLRLRPATGNYTLVNVFSGKALDVADASPANGANVQQYADNDTDAQKWKVTSLTAPRVRKLAEGWPALRNTLFDGGVDAACPVPGSAGDVYLFQAHRYLRYDAVNEKVVHGPDSLAWRAVGFLVGGSAPDAAVVVPGSSTEVYLFRGEKYGRANPDSKTVTSGPTAIASGWPGLAGTDFAAGGLDAAANKPGSASEVYLFKGDAFLTYDATRETVTQGPAPIVEGWPGLQGTPFTSAPSAAVVVPGSASDIYLFKGDSYVRLPAVAAIAPSPSPSAPRKPVPGTYTLTNVGSGKALDAAADGSVVQWTGHGGANQRWTLTVTGDGAYTLTSPSTGKVLDVTSASRDNGARVQQWEGNGSAAQQWRLAEAGDGVYQLQCVGSGKFLDVKDNSKDDGAHVHQWDRNTFDSQKWRLAPAG